MSEYKDFSSMPPDTESQFVVFEKTSVEALKKARIIAGIVAMIVLVSILSVVYSQEKPENLMAHDDMGMLQKAPAKESKESKEAPAEEAAPAAEGAEGAADGDKADGDKADGDKAADADGEKAKDDKADGE